VSEEDGTDRGLLGPPSHFLPGRHSYWECVGVLVPTEGRH
jgi:hypothetical protein